MRNILFAILMLNLLAACDHAAPTSNTTFEAAHTAANSLDYYGEYVGIFPCVDCKGVEVHINIKPDNTFLYASNYLESENISFQYAGQWQIDKSIITLIDTVAKYKESYFVGEHYLQQVDSLGNVMHGEQEDDYKLKKILSHDSIM